MGSNVLEIIARLEAQTGKFEAALDRANKRTDTFSQKASSKVLAIDQAFVKVGAKIDEHVIRWGKRLAFAGFAAGSAAVTKAVYDAAAFGKSMREVNTMLNLSESEFAGLKKQVLDLAKGMGVDAVENVRALYQAVSAGIPKENLISFLAVANRAAIAGVTDVKTAVDGLTNVLNAFGMKADQAEHVADILFTAVKGGKTTFAELAAYMFQVAPIASAAGVTLESLAAAIISLTKLGVPTSVAATQIRQAIQALLKPTEDMKKLLSSIGYESGEALIKSRGLQGAFGALTEAARGNNEVLGNAVGSVEALQAVLSTTGNNARTAAADLQSMQGAAGAMQGAFAQMELDPRQQWEHFLNNLQAIGIEVGTTIIEKLNLFTPKLQEGAEALSRWVDLHAEETIQKIGDAFKSGYEFIEKWGKTLLVIYGTLKGLALLKAAGIIGGAAGGGTAGKGIGTAAAAGIGAGVGGVAGGLLGRVPFLAGRVVGRAGLILSNPLAVAGIGAIAITEIETWKQKSAAALADVKTQDASDRDKKIRAFRKAYLLIRNVQPDYAESLKAAFMVFGTRGSDEALKAAISYAAQITAQGAARSVRGAAKTPGAEGPSILGELPGAPVPMTPEKRARLKMWAEIDRIQQRRQAVGGLDDWAYADRFRPGTSGPARLLRDFDSTGSMTESQKASFAARDRSQGSQVAGLDDAAMKMSQAASLWMSIPKQLQDALASLPAVVGRVAPDAVTRTASALFP